MSKSLPVIDGKVELVKGNLPELYKEANELHRENKAAAETVANNVVRLGIVLQQISASVAHGEFLPAMAKHCPDISQSACYNYMRTASELAILEISKSFGNLRALLPSERKAEAKKAVGEINWLDLPFKPDALVERVNGRQISDVYVECGVIKPKKVDGGFRPDADAVHQWLQKHHPKLLGTAYADLPEKIQKAFKKQYRPKAPPPEMIVEGIRAKARAMFDQIAESKHEKECKHFEPEFVANLKRLMKDYIADLEKLEKRNAEKEEK